MEHPTFFNHARQAGLAYLVVVGTGIVSLGWVPGQTIVRGDGAATAARIAAAEPLFRVGIAAGLLCQLSFIVLGLCMYRLLRTAGPGAAALMVTLVLVSVPIALVNQTHLLAMLTVVRDAATRGLLDSPDVARAVLQRLSQYRDGMLVSELFWGLWLLPMGWLFWRTRHVPRPLAALLLVGGAGYLVDAFGTVLVASYGTSALAGWATRPAGVAEIGTCLWLLARGAPEPAT